MEEVHQALKAMGAIKALSMDGFPAIFFQKFWVIMRHDVCSFCLGVLNDGLGLESVNRANIVLLLKIPNPTSMANFHPTGLCTVIYKIIARMMANLVLC